MSRNARLAVALFGALFGVGVALVSVRAADDGHDDTTGGDRYSIDSRILFASDDDPIPPTLFGRYPSKGVLSFIAVGEVTNGKLGTVHLDGTKFAMFGRAAGDWKRGKRFDALSLYLDEDATPEQRKAMGTVFRTDELFRSEGMTSLSTMKINIDRSSTDPIARTVVRFGVREDRGEFEIRPMPGADGSNPIGIQNAFSFFDEKEPVSLGTANIRFSDHGRELRTTNSSGEIHHARLTGTVHGIVEEPGR